MLSSTFFLFGVFILNLDVRPKGVKKPYNPVLGEIFRCKWNFDNKTEGYFVSEQVSHHPPMSAYYFTSPENNITICGEIRPTSKFLGNSAATIMGGHSKIKFTNRNEEYHITHPNVYARGIIFGIFKITKRNSVYGNGRLYKNNLSKNRSRL